MSGALAWLSVQENRENREKSADRCNSRRGTTLPRRRDYGRRRLPQAGYPGGKRQQEQERGPQLEGSHQARMDRDPRGRRLDDDDFAGLPAVDRPHPIGSTTAANADGPFATADPRTEGRHDQNGENGASQGAGLGAKSEVADEGSPDLQRPYPRFSRRPPRPAVCPRKPG
jgi:hypothetical protein